jgi:hypothetical protein
MEYAHKMQFVTKLKQEESKENIGFGNVKVEPMILELSDSTIEDVHEVLDPILL